MLAALLRIFAFLSYNSLIFNIHLLSLQICLRTHSYNDRWMITIFEDSLMRIFSQLNSLLENATRKWTCWQSFWRIARNTAFPKFSRY